MRVSHCIGCVDFPCQDIRHDRYIVPEIDLDPGLVKIILISEAAPPDSADYYYAEGEPLFEATTVAAFREAGAMVESLDDILGLGVYLTTAVKCGKIGYSIKAATIKNCSNILEEEMALFPDVRTILAMGDVAIKAINYIARKKGLVRPIPTGSTYKIRGEIYYFDKIRVFPSYLQAGPSFFIEKSKRKMIAEDIAEALQVVDSS